MLYKSVKIAINTVQEAIHEDIPEELLVSQIRAAYKHLNDMESNQDTYYSSGKDKSGE